MLGGSLSKDKNLKEDETLEDRRGMYWTKTATGDNTVNIVHNEGSIGRTSIHEREIGARLALKYSMIKKISLNKTITTDGILEVEYGEYPQKSVSHDMQRILEKSFNKNILIETEKNIQLILEKLKNVPKNSNHKLI